MIPTFNGARWITPQVESIVAQTQPPEELIVCDDGSSDGTLELVRHALEGTGIRLTVLEACGPPLGTVANLERGLRLATEQIVSLADQDDIWVPDRLEVIRDRLREGADAVFSDGSLIDDAGAKVPGTIWQRSRFGPQMQLMWASAPLRVLARRNVVTGATLAFRSKWLDAILPVQTPALHDAWIALMVAAMGGRIVADDRQLIKYRLHHANVAGLPNRRTFQRLRSIRQSGLAYGENAAHFALAARRVRDLGDPFDAASWLEEASRFWADRGLPRGPVARVQAAVRLYRSGAYHRFGSGWRAMCLDLLGHSRAPLVQQGADGSGRL